MKRISIRTVVLAGALVALASVTARADTITPVFANFLPGVSITYDLVFTSGELWTGDGVTIFDIGGFTGVVTTPAGWSFSVAPTGSIYSPPLPTGPDSPFLPNVTFTYDGPRIEEPGMQTFFGFTIGTISTQLVEDDWVSKDHTLGTLGIIDGSLAPGHTQTILVPRAVPDAGSAVALLGAGLLGMGMLRRRLIA